MSIVRMLCLWTILMSLCWTHAATSNEEVVLNGHTAKFGIKVDESARIRVLELDHDRNVYLQLTGEAEQFPLAPVGSAVWAELIDDLYQDGSSFLPKGSLLLGRVDGVYDPKVFGRDGYVQIEFYELITPEGRTFQLNPHISASSLSRTQKLDNRENKLARKVGNTALTAAAGAMVTTQMLGAAVLLAPHYALGAGVGAGLALGLAGSVLSSGKHPELMPGDELTVKFSTELVYSHDVRPKAKVYRLAAEPHYSPIALSAIDTSFIGQRFGGDLLRLKFKMDNRSRTTIYSRDIVLLAPYGKTILPEPFTEFDDRIDPEAEASIESLRTSIPPGYSGDITLTFRLDYPGLDHRLSWQPTMGGSGAVLLDLGAPIKYAKNTAGGRFRKVFDRN